jgi:hypothetical protein
MSFVFIDRCNANKFIVELLQSGNCARRRAYRRFSQKADARAGMALLLSGAPLSKFLRNACCSPWLCGVEPACELYRVLCLSYLDQHAYRQCRSVSGNFGCEKKAYE